MLELLASISSTRIVSAYSTRRTHSYSTNLAAALELLSPPTIETDEEFSSSIGSRLSAAVDEIAEPVVAVDISSGSRVRLAAVVSAVTSFPRPITVDFYYIPGSFFLPADQRRALAYSGPVSPAFVGMPGPSSVPVAAIVGVGYEAFEAMGAIALLEASDVWIFEPQDEGHKYNEVVRVENAVLLRMAGPRRRVTYDVGNPMDLYQQLEGVTYGTLGRYRAVLVPLGPKIFALTALLVSARFNREIPVWRFSSDQYGVPVDVFPSDKVIGMRMVVTEKP